jgi:hypothetical protein
MDVGVPRSTFNQNKHASFEIAAGRAAMQTVWLDSPCDVGRKRVHPWGVPPLKSRPVNEFFRR